MAIDFKPTTKTGAIDFRPSQPASRAISPAINDSRAPQGQSRGILETLVKRPLERLVLEPGRRLGEGLVAAATAPFLNDEQRARQQASIEQDVNFGPFLLRGLKPGAEGAKQIAGETLETAGLLAPVGRATKALTPFVGKTAAGAAAGGATGYALDTGAKLQEGRDLGDVLKPGVGTLAGAALPVLGAIIGKLPKKLEEVNLRMTPTEKANLAKQGKDIAQWITSKKSITGSPEARYQKVTEIYDDLEREVGRIVDGSRVTFPKAAIIDQLKNIPAKYSDNLSEYPNVVAKVERMMQTLQETRGDSISASTLNKMKRAEWKNAYNKQGSAVVNEVSDEVGRVFKEILDDAVPALKSVNSEYGYAIATRKVLHKAINRAQTGLVGKLLGTAAGAGVGGAVGGGIGAAGGAIVGEQIAAKLLGTATRSRTGAALQSVSDTLGKGQIGTSGSQNVPLKAATTVLQGATKDMQAPPAEQLPQSSPESTTRPQLSPEVKDALQRIDPSGSFGGVLKAAPKIAKALSNIHPQDLKLMEEFIDYARLNKKFSDTQFAEAEKLAQYFGVSMDKGLKGVASIFERILNGSQKAKGTVPQARETNGRFK